MLWNTSPLHHKTFKQHDLVRFYALTMKANILLACERGDADPNGFGFGAEAGKKKTCWKSRSEIQKFTGYAGSAR